MRQSLLAAWRTNHRVTIELILQLPAALWKANVPGAPRRSIRSIAAHLHNVRCRWIKTLGSEHGIASPPQIDRNRVTQKQVVAALKKSSAGIEALLELGFDSDGVLPPSKGYVWRNLSLDVGHVLTYFIAHEAHHRGQIVLVARQTGCRLTATTIAAMWQWKTK